MALPDELQPAGLAGWNERFALRDEEQMLGRFFPRVPNEVGGNTAKWEEIDRTREVANFVSYQQEGRERNLRVRRVRTEVAPTSREQKKIPGEYIQWMRAPNSRTQAMGREAVDGELADLTDMAWRRQELLRSQIFTNTLSMDIDGHTINVTVGIPAAQLLATVAVSWATGSTDLTTDIRTQMAVIAQTGGVKADTMILSAEAVGYFLNNDNIGTLISERGKERLEAGGVVGIDRIPGLDLTLVPYFEGYVNSSGTWTPFMAAESVVLFSAAGIMGKTIECSSNDAGAGTNHRGIFTHAWETEAPPRAVRISCELTALPIVQNASGIVRWTDVTAV